MKARDRGGSTTVLLLGAALLALGLGIDLGLVRPQEKRVRQLSARRQELLSQAIETQQRTGRERLRLEALGLDDRDGPPGDPVGMVGDALDAAGLHRLELGTTSNSDKGGIRHTSLFARAQGNYRQIARLVLDLETRQRIVAIETIRIDPIPESTLHEVRLGLSVYDPLEDRR